MLQSIKELVEGKKVALIGSVPPAGFDPKPWDIIVRCNDWWGVAGGRCDILFHIGASPRLKVSWLLQELCLNAGLKAMVLFEGAEHKKMSRIAEFHNLPVVTHNKETEFSAPLRRWFELRGTSPSTGLFAAYTLSLLKPQYLLITGMDLYASEPNHDGWHKHNPLGHVHWFEKLNDMEGVVLGKDLLVGMGYWKNEDCNSK
jgi:hypothetical protein